MLGSNRPVVPPSTLRDKPSTKGVAGSTSDVARRKTGEDEALLKEEEENKAQAGASLKKRMRAKKSLARASASAPKAKYQFRS